MRILICASGTGGHIFPAITLAKEFTKLGHDVSFIGDATRMESILIPKADFVFIGMNFKRYDGGILAKFKGLYSALKNYRKCLKIVSDFDRVIGFGNYVSVPVVLAACRRKIKTFIHEQNSIPGKANLLLERFVSKVFCSFKSNLPYFKNPNTLVVGNPQSNVEIKKENDFLTNLGLQNNKKTILIFFGSLGSETLDSFIFDFIKDFDSNFQLIYACGQENIAKYKNFNNESVVIVERVDGLKAMAHTDLFIGRAGATTIAEIIASKLCAILIPSPYVANNHQYYNAQFLANNKAGILLEESLLKLDSFKDQVYSLLRDDKRRNEIGLNAYHMQNKLGLNTMIDEVLSE